MQGHNKIGSMSKYHAWSIHCGFDGLVILQPQGQMVGRSEGGSDI